MDVEGENAALILPAFERATGIKVDLQWLPWTAAHQKLLTAFAGATLPDVTMLSDAWTPEFARIGAVRPPRGPLPADMLTRSAVQAQGRAFATPWTVDVTVQYYRRDLLAAAGYASPPPRWDDWRAMLRAVKRRAPDRYAVLMQLNWPDHLFNLAVQQPDPLLRDGDTRGNFRSAGFRAALAFYKSLFDDGLAPRVGSAQVADPVGELARGWVALYPAGCWTRADLRRRAAELAPERWDTAAMPGPDGVGASVAAGACLAVTRDARDPAAAARLVAYLTEPAVQARFWEVAGVLPSRREAWSAPGLRADRCTPVFAAALGRIRATPPVLEWPRIAEDVQAVAERMVRGALGVDTAAAEMDRVADLRLEKRRWLLERGRAA